METENALLKTDMVPMDEMAACAGTTAYGLSRAKGDLPDRPHLRS